MDLAIGEAVPNITVTSNIPTRERLNTTGIIAKYTSRLSIRLNIYIATVVSHPAHVNSNITG